MDIYIKSFNRAYLLHRTLASIKSNLLGFDGKIIVLDDGTPQKYLQKIQQLYPEVQVRKSPYYEQKNESILRNEIPVKLIPAMFWKEEVLKGSEHFILLEDDMWFSVRVDFREIIKEVTDLRMDMVKFLWLNNSLLISGNIVDSSKNICKVAPELFTKKAKLFEMIFRTNRFKAGGITRRFVDINKELLKYYQLYAVAGGLYSKRYYKACWNHHQDMIDELQQIQQLLQAKEQFCVGNTKQEIIRTTLKTTASLISKESFSGAFDVFKFNKLLNEYWLHHNIYLTENLDEDVPDEWIKNGLKDSEIDFNDWKKWYDTFQERYLNMGNIVG
ncbi:MAG TPA: hypothetical protein VKY82_08975 [Flavobacterium sp.]|nr:hypothetical protein [Flavobacterium sp.]